MKDDVSLGTSVLLLFISIFLATILFGNLLPNHWTKMVLIPIIGFVGYYLGLVVYFTYTGDESV